jgi:hypothetical protein
MISKFQRIAKMIGFVIVMFISTYATVESLYRLLDVSKWALWPVSIIVFVFAARGFSRIRKSFDYSERNQSRLSMLLSGIFLVVPLWFVFIIPTNTHTFFYIREIKTVTIQDIEEAKTTLENLSVSGSNFIDKEKMEFKSNVDGLIESLQLEIKNRYNIGYGPEADKIIIKLENLLGQEIQRLTPPAVRSERNLQNFAQDMGEAVRRILNVKLGEYDERKQRFESRMDKNEINEVISQLKKAAEDIKSLDEPSPEIKTLLKESYAKIKSYSDRFNEEFKNKNLESITKTPQCIQLENVIEVWKKFFNGDYAGKGFIYFIILAILIDFLGFWLYEMAFKKQEIY